MKIYIVTEGTYSDYHIDSVYTNKEQAEFRVATLELDAFMVCPQIEEYDTDKYEYEGKLVTAYEIEYNLYDGKIEDITEKKVIKGTVPKKFPNVKTGDRSIRVNGATEIMKVVADSEAQAKKIFYDLFEQALYIAYEEEAKTIISDMKQEGGTGD